MNRPFHANNTIRALVANPAGTVEAHVNGFQPGAITITQLQRPGKRKCANDTHH